MSLALCISRELRSALHGGRTVFQVMNDGYFSRAKSKV